MNKQETDLREKLGLSENQNISYKQFLRNTRNTNYIIEVDCEPMYFAKVDSEGNSKERVVYDFLKKHPLFPTPMPLYVDERLIILPFMPDFHDTSIRGCLDFIVEFHNASLLDPEIDFKKYFNNKQFENHYVKRFVSRLKRHEEMVLNFWKDIPELIAFQERNPQQIFEELPKILVHGDIQHKNLQRDSKGNLYLIDFEDSYYDSPSWDLSRALMDLESCEMNPFAEEYVNRVNVEEKELLSRAIDRDFIIRVVTDSIGRQQRFGIKGARSYLELYKQKYLKRIEDILEKW
jgi:hypothetical protein